MANATEWATLLAPKRSPFAGTLCVLIGLTAAIGAIVLELPHWSQRALLNFILVLSVPVLFGAMVVAVGVLLMLPKGALLWNAGAKQLLMTSGLPSSRLVLDSREILRLYLFHRREPWGEYYRDYFSLEAHLRGGAFVLLGESESHQNILIVGRELAKQTRLVLADLTEMDRQSATAESPAAELSASMPGISIEPEGSQTRFRWRSGMGSAYYSIIGLIGVMALVLGIALSMAIRSSIAAVFFGPVMVFCGLGALITIAEHWLAEETVTCTPTVLSRWSGLFGWRWGKLEGPLDGDFRLRLASGGIRGYGIELVTADRALSLGSGFTARARVTPSAALALIGEIQRRTTASRSAASDSQLLADRGEPDHK